MNKNLREALMSACVRLLSHYSNNLCPCESEYTRQIGVLQDIAKSMITIQEGRDGILPDVIFEALAYECQTSNPNPHIILSLTECIQKNKIWQSSYFPH